jgi:hypothetical protein
MQKQPKESIYETEFLLLIGIVFLVVIGMLMAMFSVTYIQDMSTLRNVPDILWDFTCGRPTEAGTTLPLLLTISIVCFLVSGVLSGWRWWIKKAGQHDE